jgi:hypothetical protein
MDYAWKILNSVLTFKSVEDAKAKINREFYYHHDKEECLCLIPDLKEMLPSELYTSFELIVKNFIAVNKEVEKKAQCKLVQDRVPWEDLKKHFPSDNCFKDSVALTVIGMTDAFTTRESRKEFMAKDFSYANAKQFDFNAATHISVNRINKTQTVNNQKVTNDLIMEE